MSEATTANPAARAAALAHLPLPLFAATMGIAGLGLAWREAHRVLGVPSAVGEALLLLGAVVYLTTLAFHVARAILHRGAVAAELRHPVRRMFAGAVTIGLMLLAGGLLPYDAGAAAVLWIAAVALHLTLGVWILRRLLAAPSDPATFAPPLLIPLVGNVVAPVFGAKLGYPALSWTLFGVGMILWLAIQPVILHHLFSGRELPARLKPTLVILLAPPSVGVLALVALSGGAVEPPALALYGVAALLAGVFLTMAGDFMRLPFALSWWGWTFPAAAFAAATLAVGHAVAVPAGGVLMGAVLLVATLVVAVVSWRTLRALLSGALLQPET